MTATFTRPAPNSSMRRLVAHATPLAHMWMTAFVNVVSGEGVLDNGRSYDVRPGASLCDLLDATLAACPGVQRIYLTDLPQISLSNEARGLTKTHAYLSWALNLPPDGAWREHPGKRHFIKTDDPAACALRFMHTPRAHWVEVRLLGSTWTGGLPCTPREAATLFRLLRDRLGARFPERTPDVFNTPARTGLGLYSIAAQVNGGTLPEPLPADLQQLVRSTSGQGRIELLPPPHAVELLTEAVQYDGRQMYVACLRDLGCGQATLSAGGRYEFMRPAQYHVRFQVLAQWPDGMPGLLPVTCEGERGDKRWWWPAQPCSGPYETWVSDAELRVALWPFAAAHCHDCVAGFAGTRGDVPCPIHGWRVQVLETLAFTPPAARIQTRRGPLDLWHDRLTAIQREIADDERMPLHVRHLAQKALRAILIDTVGAFARGPWRDVSRATMHPGEVPRDADPEVIESREGLLYVYNERARFEAADDAWIDQYRHPEFSAQVWGRARARMLLAQGKVGATGLLTLPPYSGIAIVSDALYLAQDPGWPDDGANGRLRPKLRHLATGEPQLWPQDDAGLRRLRAAMAPVEEKPACCRDTEAGGGKDAGERTPRWLCREGER